MEQDLASQDRTIIILSNFKLIVFTINLFAVREVNEGSQPKILITRTGWFEQPILILEIKVLPLY